MSKMLATYGLTRLPFSKDIPTSEMLDTEALQTARERLMISSPRPIIASCKWKSPQPESRQKWSAISPQVCGGQVATRRGLPCDRS